MTIAHSKNFPGEVNSFLVALQDESEFANSLRQVTSIKAEDEVLESQGFDADAIRRDLRQVTFTDPVSSEQINLLSWMSIHCQLDNSSAGISISAFVNALSSEGVTETISQSAEFHNFASMIRSLAGGVGNSTAPRSKIPHADQIGDAGETKDGGAEIVDTPSEETAGTATRSSERSASSSADTTMVDDRNIKEAGAADLESRGSQDEDFGRDSSSRDDDLSDRGSGHGSEVSRGSIDEDDQDKERSADGGEKGRDDLEDDGIEFRDAFDTGMVSGDDRVRFVSQFVDSADRDYAANVRDGYAKQGYDGQMESRKMYVDSGKVDLAQSKSRDIDQDYETQSNVERNLRGSSKVRALTGEGDDEPTKSSSGEFAELKSDEEALNNLSGESPTGSGSDGGDGGGDDSDPVDLD
jgi:hypothetical protein